MKCSFHFAVVLTAAFLVAIGQSPADEAEEIQKLNKEIQEHIAGGRFTDAESAARKRLEIAEKSFDHLHAAVAISLVGLARVYDLQQRSADAEPLCDRALAIIKQLPSTDHAILAECLLYIGENYRRQNRFADAETVLQESLSIGKKLLGDDHVGVSAVLSELGRLRKDQQRFAEADSLYQVALAIQKKKLKNNHPAVAVLTTDIARLRQAQGQYPEAGSLFREALRIRTLALGANHRLSVESRNDLTQLQNLQLQLARDRANDWAAISEKELADLKQRLGADHPDVIQFLKRSAERHKGAGIKTRPDAIALYQELLAAQKRTLGAEHLDVAATTVELADLCRMDRRYNDAEPLLREGLAIRRNSLGNDHPAVMQSLSKLSELYLGQPQRRQDEETVRLELLSVQKKILGAEHVEVANTLSRLADLKRAQIQDIEAEALYRETLAVQRKVFAAGDYRIQSTLINLSTLNQKLKRWDEVRRLMDDEVSNPRQDSLGDLYRFGALFRRANFEWSQGFQTEALAYLRRALDVSDNLREEFLGDEQERAQAFEGRLHAYGQMLKWQATIGDMSETLATIERSRARSLQDQLKTAQLDLFAEMPKADAERLRKRERDVLSRIADLETKLSGLAARADLDDAEKEKLVQQLSGGVQSARSEFARVYAEIRKSSPTYRRAIGQNDDRISLDSLQTWVDQEEALLIEYVFSSWHEGYAMIVSAHNKPRLATLTHSQEQAAVLGITGWKAVTSTQLAIALSTSPKVGVLKLLSDPEKNEEARTRLAALWEMLFPEPERTALRAGKFKRLIIIPDGILSVFPFETLVADAIGEPEYLLDFGPPIEYAPSATILHNLVKPRSAVSSSMKKEPVLSVAVANYDTSVADVGDAALTLRSTRSAYRRCGGLLSNLPGAKKECEWLVDNFQTQTIPVKMLFNANATESAVRAELAGRRLLHLACHGLVDTGAGNLFGALALAPSQESDPANDGFLTLAEIYGCNLNGCELALLSACETNLGKLQQGEGVWALSRGFLVAGARRVIASNWVVPDDATPTLVSYFCALVAEAEKAGRIPDYAAALQQAKRELRNKHPQWSRPYYWAPLVLVGPH